MKFVTLFLPNLLLAAPVLLAAEPANTYGVAAPELRSRNEVNAVLNKAPKPPSEASLRPLTILLAGGAKDHPPQSHSHDMLPKRWIALLGGTGPGEEAVSNMYRPQVEADRDAVSQPSSQVDAICMDASNEGVAPHRGTILPAIQQPEPTQSHKQSLGKAKKASPSP